MIEAHGLTKDYGKVRAIEDVSFQVETGQVLGFLGPNAAGKTTTMRIITGFFPPTRGRVLVAGYDVLDQPMEARRRVGYLPETVPIYPDQRVDTYLDFVAGAKGIPARERKPQIAAVLDQCGLRDVANWLVGKLSKGYRQRVGLAQALLGDPPVLILDEPTVGLDPAQIVEIREIIKSFADKRTVILSTHILPEVSMTCSRVIIINQGRIVAQDTPDNLNRQVNQAARVEMLVDGPADQIIAVLKGMEGVGKVIREEGTTSPYRFLVETPRDRDLRRQLAAAMVQKDWGLLELRSRDLTLEEIFLNLVTGEGGEEQ